MMPRPDLSAKLCGIRMGNPTMLASGVLGETAGSMLRVAKSGAGAIVTKSISREPRPGYPNPTIVESEHGLINAMGLPNPGINEFAKELRDCVKNAGVPIIGSIFGAEEFDYGLLAARMEYLGVAAVELNLSCPHVKGMGAEIGSDPAKVEKFTHEVRKNTKLPVFVKLTPNISSIADIGLAAQRGGADAVVAVNTLRGMAIDISMAKPVLYNKVGGYSGGAIKPVGVRAVYDLRRALKIPIVGSGGVMTGEDAVEYIMAGASAVQVGSAVYYRGIDAFSKITKEISAFMAANKYKSLDEMAGIAAQG